MTTAAILTIGDELLAGEIIDSNSAWIAAALVELGLDVRTKSAVGDEMNGLVAEVARLSAAHDVVICTGGLGPTSDDRTREAIAEAAGVALVHHDDLAERLVDWFASRGVRMPASNLRQAQLPAGATVLQPVGTAPGFALVSQRCLIAALPGVPWELHAMFTADLEPLLVALPGIRPSVTRVVRVSGMGESAVAEALRSVETTLPDDVVIAYLASSGEIRVKLTARGADRATARSRTDAALAEVVRLLGDSVVAIDGGTLEEMVVHRYLADGRTIACAESASGGVLLGRLTSVAGASAVVLGGAVSYTASSKVLLADVDQAVIDEHGLVARATTEAMAVGIRARLAADVGVATTGVAGPGGMNDKVVGTIIWAVATAEGVRSWERELPGDREAVRQRLATAALEGLRRA